MNTQKATQELVKKDNLCRAYINGNCSYRFCRYVHKIPKEITNNTATIITTTTDEKNTKEFTFTPVKPPSPTMPNYRKRLLNGEQKHNNNNNNSVDFKSTIVCRDFKNGDCKFGDKCRYVHNNNLQPTSTPPIPILTSKQIYVGNIKAIITTGFKITNLVLETNNSMHLIIFNPPTSWYSKEIISNLIQVPILKFAILPNQFKLYFDNYKHLETAKQVISNIGICKKHNEVSCPNINCIVSQYLNKIQVVECCKSYFNEILIKPNAGSNLTLGSLESYLINNGINGYRKIKETGQGLKKHKFLIKFESDIQASKLILAGNIIPNAEISIVNEISINYKTQDLQHLGGVTLVEYVTSKYPRNYYKPPSLIMSNDKNVIQIQQGCNQSRLFVRRTIMELIEPTVLNYSRALLIHINKTIITTWIQDINVTIDVNVPFGKIIIRGLPNNRKKVETNIKEYFVKEKNLLVEEVIPLGASVCKSQIKKTIMHDQDLMTKLGVEFKILSDDVIITGPENKVLASLAIVTSIISKITEIFSQNKDIKNNNIITNSETCVFCMDTAIQQVALKSCKCVYCRECLKHLLTSTLTNYENKVDEIACLSCKVPLLLSDANILNQDELKVIYQAALNKYLVVNWNKYYKCPTADCDNYMEQSEQQLFYCSQCSMMYCKNCDTDYHGKVSHEGVSCDIFQKRKKDNKADEEWLKLHSKPCPNCAIAIEKNEGCNHMTCIRCRYEFCWKCSNPWNAACYRCTAE
jgi:hypothetical protein